MRRIFEDPPDRPLRLVDQPIGGGLVVAPDLSPEFVLRPCDLWVFTTGPDRLAQVEYVREVPRTLLPQMMLHRAAIAQAHPGEHLDQYVIVVGDGEIRPPDDPVNSGHYFGLNVLYLKDVEPYWFEAGHCFALLRNCTVAPLQHELLDPLHLSLGRFLISEQDGIHDPAVLHEGAKKAREGIPEHLSDLYFNGRFGRHPQVRPEHRGENWALDIAIALAVHAITEFQHLTQRWGIH